MLINEALNVHPELKDAHEKVKCRDNCCCGRKHKRQDYACPNFVGCGPDIPCGVPCRHCIAWEGYGGDEVVNAVKTAAQPA